MRKFILTLTASLTLAQLAQSDKARTQFDGVVHNGNSQKFLRLEYDEFADFPLGPSQQVGRDQDLTMMFFYRRQNLFFDEMQETQQFLQFQNSILCKFTYQTTIICDTPSRASLKVTYSRDYQSNWLHFTLNVSSTGQAFLQIRDGNEIIAEDQTDSFFYQHSKSVCFGMCNAKLSEFAYYGDIRELFLRNYSVRRDELTPDFIHTIQAYKIDVLGYYRLSDAMDHFSNKKAEFGMLPEFDQVRRGKAEAKTGQFLESSLPVDVCPVHFVQKTFPKFDGDLLVSHQWENSLKERNWGYTMSLTLFVDRDTCYVRSPYRAAQNCHLISFNEVFTLYFSEANQARFHFYADRNYYESQTPKFFVPFNQWITIQMSMSQYGGYKVVTLDEDGEILLQMSRSTNLYRQFPQEEVNMLKGFKGLASRFILTDKSSYVPSPHYKLSEPLFNIDFEEYDSNQLPNLGSVGDLYLSNNDITLSGMQLKSVPYKVYEYQQPHSELGQRYDGVTCDDGHMAVRLDRDKTDIKFNIRNPVETNQSSLQFWFKFGDKGYLQAQDIYNLNDIDIFQMHHTNQTQNQVWSIFLRDNHTLQQSGEYLSKRQLIIAPFGKQEQTMVFRNLTVQAEDQYQWWHLSCSQNQTQVTCQLHNSLYTFQQTIQVSSAQQFKMLQGQYECQFFNFVDELYVKQFRLFSDYQTDSQVYLSRHYTPSANTTSLLHQTSFHQYEALMQPDFLRTSYVQYNENTKQLDRYEQKQYHAICPVQTYYKDNQCYKDPINQLEFNVFPIYEDQELFWFFTIENSNFISNKPQDQIIDKVQVEMAVDNDQMLGWVFEITLIEYGTLTSFMVPASGYLRHENTYMLHSTTISSELSRRYTQLQFIPNHCRWYDVVDSDSYQSYHQLEQLPGFGDITFYLQLKQSQIECADDFLFYDQLAKIDYRLLTSDGYIESVSKIDWFVIEGVGVSITIPQGQQDQLPVFTDIKLILDLQYQSSFMESRELAGVQQNVMVTFNLQPSYIDIITHLQVNTEQVSKGQTLIMSANKTSVTSISNQVLTITYNWVCPLSIRYLCADQTTSDTLYIPYSELRQQFDYTQLYEFTVEASWTNPETLQKYAHSQSTSVRWYPDGRLPLFEIQCEEMVDVKRCELQGVSFDARWALQDAYQVDWLITPKAQGSYIRGQQFVIEKSSLVEDQQYIVVAYFNLKDYPEMGGSLNQQFTHTNQTVPETPEEQHNQTEPIPPSEANQTESNQTEPVQPGDGNQTETSPPGGNNQTEPVQPSEGNVTDPALPSEDNSTDTSPSSESNQTEPIPPSEANQTEPIPPSEANQTEPIPPSEANQTEPTPPEQGNQTEPAAPEDTVQPSDPTPTNNTDPTIPDETPPSDPDQSNTTSEDIPQNQTRRRLQSKSIDDFIYDHTYTDDVSEQSWLQDFIDLVASQPNSLEQLKQYDELCDLFTSEELLPVLHLIEIESDEISEQVMNRVLQLFTLENYRSHKIQISNELFSFDTVLNDGMVKALDSVYMLDSYDLYSQLPTTPEDEQLYLQMIAVQRPDAFSLVSLRVMYGLSQQVFQLGELSGQAQVSFSVTEPDQYRSNQTMCSTLDGNLWISDFCLTEVDPELRLVSCRCNMIESQVVTLKDDFTRDLAEPVDFNFTVSNQHQNDIEGVSNLFFTVVIMITMIGCIVTVICSKLDENAWKEIKADKHFDWQIKLINQVQEQLGESSSFEMVKLRKQSLISYYVQRYSLLTYITWETHPIYIPAMFDPIQPRVIRFNAYWLQLNLYSCFCMLVFKGDQYRYGDMSRTEYVIDAKDIGYITLISGVGAIALLPLLNFLTWIMRDSIIFDAETGKAELKEKKILVRGIFLVLCQICNLMTVISAVFIVEYTPTTNQYLIAFSILGGLIFATFGTNMFRVMFNCYAPQWLSKFKSQKARQIIQDVKIVSKIILGELTGIKLEDLPTTTNLNVIVQTEEPLNREAPVLLEYSHVLEQAPESARGDQI